MPSIRSTPVRDALFAVLFVLLSRTPLPAAEPIRVLPPETVPMDARLGDLKTLDDYFPFTPPESPDIWRQRSERVRRQVLVATGLWPMPAKTPDNAVIHGRVDRPEYTVERVYLESFPGHFVTGSLYRPKNRTGRLPGVLCPHGHFQNGRFYDAGEEKLKEQLASGAEQFDPSGRFPIQARCVQLARMGCVVFQYDMVGYADSQQLDHRPGIREAMNTGSRWGYFSPQAELRLQNMMGLQTYNSIRALDWFAELPDVDPQRIAVTGASGGGTQTFILCAIDSRPAVAFPAVMVSTAMQGGCSCENACYLRVDSGNVEIAGLIAPRPLGMTAADDWTVELATKGLPELKRLYAMLGAESLVMAQPFTQFPHNYNYVSRAVMYTWMNKHLGLGLEEPIVEQDFHPLSVDELTVWNDAHPAPPSGDPYERDLVEWITRDSDRQMSALVPKDAASLKKFRRVVGGGVEVMIGHGVPSPDSVTVTVPANPVDKHETYTLVKALVHGVHGSELPTVTLFPSNWNRQAVIWITPQGKAGLMQDNGEPIPAIQALLEQGVAVIGADLFGQGEFTADGKPLEKTRLNESGRGDWARYAGYTFGYNHSVFSKRVHDVLTLIALCQMDPMPAERLQLVGVSGAGHWVAAAASQAKDVLHGVAVDTAGFRFADVQAMDDPDFLPGGAKYLDLPGMLALAAPCELWLAGEKETPAVMEAAYRASGKPDRVTVIPPGTQRADAIEIAEWLLR